MRAVGVGTCALLALCGWGCTSVPQEQLAPPECTAGEGQLYVTGCDAGIPADSCAVGFESDGAMGCTPILPAEPCGLGQMALPGETACRELSDCGAAPWGNIPVEPDNQFVDAAYAGGNSDGSEAAPWLTVSDALSNAADGAIIAIAEGSYAEELLVTDKAVRLWGRCAALVELSGSDAQGATVTIYTGADSTEVRDLALTGDGGGIFLSGSTDVVVENVWVHDSGGRGIALQTELGTPSMSIRGSLVENATDIGVHALGSELTVETSSIRDTRENSQYSTGYGLSIQPNQDDGTSATAQLSQLVLERNRTASVLLVGSAATVTDSVIRDTQPSDLSSRDGVGIIAQNEEMVGSMLTVRGSVVANNHARGIAVVASSATIETTHFADTQPQEWDRNTGEGIGIIDADGLPSSADISMSTFDRNHSSGVFVRGSSATLTRVLVRDTKPRGSDSAFGRGVAIVGAPDENLLGQATIDACMVDGGHTFGVWVADASVDISATMIRDIQPQQFDGAFGDGVGVASMAAEQPSAWLGLVGSRLERNANAGASIFGAHFSTESSSLECNQLSLEGFDSYFGTTGTVIFDDAGDNRCGCGANSEPCELQ